MAPAARCSTRSCATSRAGLDVPARALERDVTRPAEPIGGRAARDPRGLPPRRRGRRRSPSAWSTSTRAAGVALPPREDGRAHDRRQDGHRRLGRRRVPAHDAVPADVPGPVGRPAPAVSAGRSRPTTCGAHARTRSRPHYARFRVGERLLLTGHSHQAWPDVALEGVVEAFDDAARRVDEKWERAFAKADARARRLRRAARRPGAPSRARARTRTSSSCGSCRRSTSRAAAPRHDRRRVPHAAPPARAPGRGRARGRARRRRRPRTRWPSASPPRSTTAPRRCSCRPCCSRRRGSSRASTRSPRACAAPRRRAARRRLPRARTACRSRCRELGLERRVGRRRRLQVPASSARATASCACRRRRRELRPVITGWFAEFDALADRARARRPVAYGAPARRASPARPTTRRATTAPRASFDFFAERGLTPALLRGVLPPPGRAARGRGFDALDLPAGRPDPRPRRRRSSASAASSRSSSPHAGRPAGPRSRTRGVLDRQPRALPAARARAVPVRRPAARGRGASGVGCGRICGEALNIAGRT